MCYLCYHKRGRTKLAFACEHKNEVHYSKGLCQNCYISQYSIVNFSYLTFLRSVREGVCKERLKIKNRSLIKADKNKII